MRGIVAAGGVAVLGGVLPTPAVALLAQDLGTVVSASHNPPEYNGVKLFDPEGRKLTDAEEEEIEALIDSPAERRTAAPSRRLDSAADGYSSTSSTVSAPSSPASGSRSTAPTAPKRPSPPAAFERLGAEVTAIANAPDGRTSTSGCGATDLALLQDVVRNGAYDLGVAFDGDGDRMLAVDEDGQIVDGDQIVAVLALALGVDKVAVTVDDESRLPPADGGAGHRGARRPTSATGTCSRRSGARARCSAASSPGT